MKKLFFILICLLLISTSPGYSQNKELKKITFLPSWVPQQQFAGYYMAKEKGIYEKYGLDVNIMTGGYEHNVINSLVSGEADFGILFLYTGVMERAKGTKLVNIGQMFQKSGIMFVAKKKSGIKTLKDFNGKKIGIWRTTVTELTNGFLKKHNINAEIILFDKGINVFLKDAVDITIMMNYNEYKRLINSGVDPDEINTFYFSDYDMNFPEDGIYCMESTIKKDPGLCKKFIDASIEGWNYAFANEDETIKVIDKYKEIAKVSYNRSHSLWMLNSMKEMLNTSGKNVQNGNLLESDFNRVTKFLHENRFIDSVPLYNDFYKGGR